MSLETPSIHCRQIVEADLPALADLLAKSPPSRGRFYWSRALDRLARRETPQGRPRFGYLLEAEGKPVGVVLLIFSQWRARGDAVMRCNMTGWHVEPDYRGHSSLLIAAATRDKTVTYVASPDVPAQEAHGFTRFRAGEMLALPAFSPWVAKAQAREFDPMRDYGDMLSAEERDLLAAHAANGCLAFVVHEKRAAHPFVFLPRTTFFGLVPTAQLVYCRGLDDFARFAGPIGRALTRRGFFVVAFDAPGKLRGLVGAFLRGRGPRYFKGPDRPRFGDIAFSPVALFGP